MTTPLDYDNAEIVGMTFPATTIERHIEATEDGIRDNEFLDDEERKWFEDKLSMLRVAKDIAYTHGKIFGYGDSQPQLQAQINYLKEEVNEILKDNQEHYKTHLDSSKRSKRGKHTEYTV